MALDRDTSNLVQGLENRLSSYAVADETHHKYYEGTRRLQQIGLSVPPELRTFEMSANWCRTYVDTLTNRLSMRFFYNQGDKSSIEALREGWDANNLDSQSLLHHRETLILGRGFVSVGSNEEDPEHPLIQVESAREISVDIDPRHRRLRSAARFYGADENSAEAKFATLYEPDRTRWLERTSAGWNVVDQDDHRLGRVPLVMFLNRQRLGSWDGVSELTDLMPIVDGNARALTDLQLAIEVHAVPKRFVLGAKTEDFQDPSGNPMPKWEAYQTSLMALEDASAKVGQLDAADLKNFHETVAMYGQLAASVTGLPLRFFGQTSVNPASEGAINADESGLIKHVETVQSLYGDNWSWVMGLYERFRTGSWTEGTQIKAEWFDPATPTYAQRADALTKQYAGGQGVLSREGTWEEMGWSEDRMDRERKRFESESLLALTSLEKDVSEEL